MGRIFVREISPLFESLTCLCNNSDLLLHALEVLGKPHPRRLVSSNDDVMQQGDNTGLTRRPIGMQNRTDSMFRLHSL